MATFTYKNGLFLTLGSGTSSAWNENLSSLFNRNIPLISGTDGLWNHFWPLESGFLMRKSEKKGSNFLGWHDFKIYITGSLTSNPSTWLKQNFFLFDMSSGPMWVVKKKTHFQSSQRPKDSRDPETQRPSDPKTQRSSDPETRRPRDSETQRIRDPDTQTMNCNFAHVDPMDACSWTVRW